MSKLALILCCLGLAACSVEEDDRPTIPGGFGMTGGGGGSGGDDLPVDAGPPDVETVELEFCRVEDFRFVHDCRSYAYRISGSPLILVEESGEVIHDDEFPRAAVPTSAGQATFLLFPASVRHLLRRVGLPITSPTIELPFFYRNHWEDLIAALGLAQLEAQPAVLLYLANAQGQALVDAQVSVLDGRSHAPYYAGSEGPLDWAPARRTGASGAILLLDVDVSEPELAVIVTDAAGNSTRVDQIPVRPNTVTFHEAVIPPH